MRYISIFDIISPIMIGPSSSHTAGAIRMGLFARKIFGKEPKKVLFRLYNSFAKTGKGHGTDKAILGGILGFEVEDARIKESFNHAKEQEVEFSFEFLEKDDRYPNSADIVFLGENNEILMEISGKSKGGGAVQIDHIDGFSTDIRGDYPVLLMVYKDQKGVISKVTKLLQEENINIATLDCDRKARNGEAIMTICLDAKSPKEITNKIKELPDMYLVKSIERLDS